MQNNGERASQIGLPPVVSTTALELESDNTVLALSVDRSNTVPTTAARGDDGGTNGPVYSAAPLMMRKFEMSPLNWELEAWPIETSRPPM